MSDAKEWVTVKVPKEQRDEAKDTAPQGVTYGECLVAGARELSEGNHVGLTATVTPTLDEDKVDQLVAELKSRIGEADLIGAQPLDYDDVRAAAKDGAREAIEESVQR